jgi:hypothetical protein
VKSDLCSDPCMFSSVRTHTFRWPRRRRTHNEMRADPAYLEAYQEWIVSCHAINWKRQGYSSREIERFTGGSS